MFSVQQSPDLNQTAQSHQTTTQQTSFIMVGPPGKKTGDESTEPNKSDQS